MAARDQRREPAARGRLGGRAGHVSLDSWPQRSRLIVRRERPHPGAQLSFTDVDGHRFQCFITDQPGGDLAALEARHRAHAIVEDRVRDPNSTGLANLPFSAFAANQAWLEAALDAHELIVWTQLLLFDGEHAVCEPKRLRYRLLHVAGRNLTVTPPQALHGLTDESRLAGVRPDDLAGHVVRALTDRAPALVTWRMAAHPRSSEPGLVRRS